MDLSIIIVSWNVRDKLLENLSAIFESRRDISFEVFVVDNDSSDQTADSVRARFPEVRLIANAENRGFAKANNQAIRLAQGRYILLLNPDMRVAPDTLSNAVRWFDENPQAAVAGCKLVDEQGRIVRHVRRFPSLADQLAIVLKLPHLMPKVLDRYLAADFDYGKASRVDSVRGSFFLMRRIGSQLPLLDERYFIWFEEVDFCRQAALSSREVWYTPAATCTDFVGASFSQVDRGRTQGYFRDSMLKYFEKWHPRWQYLILRAAWPFGRLAAVLADKAYLKPRSKT